MKTTVKIAALMIGAGLAMPAFAQMMQIDAGALTCDAFLASDAATKAEAVNAVMSYVNDAANTETTAAAAEVIKGLDEAATQQAIDAACGSAAAGTTVPQALQKKE